jgi:hypothetical protein
MQSFGKHPVGTFKVIHRSNSGRVPIAQTMLRTAACNSEDFNAVADNGWAFGMATETHAMHQLSHPDAGTDPCLPAAVAGLERVKSSSKYACTEGLTERGVCD